MQHRTTTKSSNFRHSQIGTSYENKGFAGIKAIQKVVDEAQGRQFTIQKDSDILETRRRQNNLEQSLLMKSIGKDNNSYKTKSVLIKMANSKDDELTEVPATAVTAKTGNTVIIPQPKLDSDNALTQSPDLPLQAMHNTLRDFNKQTDMILLDGLTANSDNQ